MPLLDRIRRIARANIQHLLNQAETPESEVEAKIKELEEGAVEAKNALASFAVTYKRLEKNVETLRASVGEHQQRAEQALQAGDESTARRALADKLKTGERLKKMTPVLESRRETYDELKDALVEIHDQLNQARARLMDLRSRRRAAEAERAMGGTLEEVRGPDGESFERMEDEVVESESQTEADRELREELTPRSVEDTLRDREVEDELEALKAKLSGGPEANGRPS